MKSYEEVDPNDLNMVAGIAVHEDGEFELLLPPPDEDDPEVISSTKLLTACFMKLTTDGAFVEELIQWITDVEQEIKEKRVLQ